MTKNELKSLYAMNAENEKGSDNFYIISVDSDMDEVTGKKVINFPVDSEKCFFERMDNSKSRYWKLYRYKPLMFDVVMLEFEKIIDNMATSCKKVKSPENLFSWTVDAQEVERKRLSCKLMQCRVNAFEGGKIIERVINEERRKEVMLGKFKIWMESVFFSAQRPNSEFSIKEDYEKLIFL